MTLLTHKWTGLSIVYQSYLQYTTDEKVYMFLYYLLYLHYYCFIVLLTNSVKKIASGQLGVSLGLGALKLELYYSFIVDPIIE